MVACKSLSHLLDVLHLHRLHLSEKSKHCRLDTSQHKRILITKLLCSPPLPLLFPEKWRRSVRATGLLARGTGDVALLLGLKASGLASLLRNSFSSVDNDLGSTLVLKLSVAEAVLVLRGRNRSGDLIELVDLMLEVESKVLNEGRRRNVLDL